MWEWLWRRRRPSTLDPTEPRHDEHEYEGEVRDPQEAREEEVKRRLREHLNREIEQVIERLQAKVDVYHERERGHR